MIKHGNYIVTKSENAYIIKHKGIVLSLDGVGILKFDSPNDAVEYIRCIQFAKSQINSGVPE